MNWVVWCLTGIAIGAAGGTLAATYNGGRWLGGVVVMAAGSLFAWRAWFGPAADSYPAPILIICAAIAMIGAGCVPMAVRLIWRGDFTPFRVVAPAPAQAGGASTAHTRPGYVSPNAQTPIPTVEERRAARRNYTVAGG